MRKRNLGLWLAVSAVAMPVVVVAETEELSSAAKNVNTTLNKLTDASSKSAVTSARTAYNKLSDDDKFSIYNTWLTKLVPLEAKFFAADVSALIEKKDTATMKQVETLQLAYDDKEWEIQELAYDAYMQLYDLQTYVENAPYREEAAQFMKKLAALQEATITQAQYDAIVLAYEELDYIALDYVDVTIVDAKLEVLQNALHILHAAVVQKMIDAATKENSTEETLNNIIAAYDNLAYEAQDLIVNYEKIDDLQTYVANAPYREAAAQFMKKLDSLTEVTITQAQYDEIVLAYEALEYESLEVLDTSAIDTKLAALQHALYMFAAVEVQKAIEAITEQNVTQVLLDAIEEQYSMLDFEVQGTVTNYEQLQAWYDYVLNEEMIAMELDSAILELNEESSLAEVQAIYDEYNGLSALAKSFITQETITYLQEALKQAGIADQLLEEQATKMIRDIDAIWGKVPFSSSWSTVQDAFDEDSLALQDKVTNQQKLLQYKVMAGYWGNKTKLWKSDVIKVNTTKEWAVTFSTTILNTEENLKNVKVFDESGVEQSIEIKVQNANDAKGNQLVITHANKAYEVNKQYVLIINENLKSNKNEQLSEGIWQYFVVQ